MVQQRVLETAGRSFFLRVTAAAREFLLMEGTDLKYGARHLKRAIERYVVYPLARLVATDQVNVGDMLLIDRHPGDRGLAFLKRYRTVLRSFGDVARDSEFETHFQHGSYGLRACNLSKLD